MSSIGIGTVVELELEPGSIVVVTGSDPVS
jgi:hypothetical protein